ncbi:MAG: hypothetical protein QQN41_01340 [Nitrosopumilus sp.]
MLFEVTWNRQSKTTKKKVVLRTKIIEAETGDEAIINFRLKKAKKPMEFDMNPATGIVRHTPIDYSHTYWYYQAEPVKNCKQLQIVTV